MNYTESRQFLNSDKQNNNYFKNFLSIEIIKNKLIFSLD